MPIQLIKPTVNIDFVVYPYFPCHAHRYFRYCHEQRTKLRRRLRRRRHGAD